MCHELTRPGINIRPYHLLFFLHEKKVMEIGGVFLLIEYHTSPLSYLSKELSLIDVYPDHNH
jgi:hypothetical protein